AHHLVRAGAVDAAGRLTIGLTLTRRALGPVRAASRHAVVVRAAQVHAAGVARGILVTLPLEAIVGGAVEELIAGLPGGLSRAAATAAAARAAAARGAGGA